MATLTATEINDIISYVSTLDAEGQEIFMSELYIELSDTMDSDTLLTLISNDYTDVLDSLTTTEVDDIINSTNNKIELLDYFEKLDDSDKEIFLKEVYEELSDTMDSDILMDILLSDFESVIPNLTTTEVDEIIESTDSKLEIIDFFEKLDDTNKELFITEVYKELIEDGYLGTESDAIDLILGDFKSVVDTLDTAAIDDILKELEVVTEEDFNNALTFINNLDNANAIDLFNYLINNGELNDLNVYLKDFITSMNLITLNRLTDALKNGISPIDPGTPLPASPLSEVKTPNIKDILGIEDISELTPELAAKYILEGNLSNTELNDLFKNLNNGGTSFINKLLMSLDDNNISQIHKKLQTINLNKFYTSIAFGTSVAEVKPIIEIDYNSKIPVDYFMARISVGSMITHELFENTGDKYKGIKELFIDRANILDELVNIEIISISLKRDNSGVPFASDYKIPGAALYEFDKENYLSDRFILSENIINYKVEATPRNFFGTNINSSGKDKKVFLEKYSKSLGKLEHVFNFDIFSSKYIRKIEIIPFKYTNQPCESIIINSPNLVENIDLKIRYDLKGIDLNTVSTSAYPATELKILFTDALNNISTEKYLFSGTGFDGIGSINGIQEFDTFEGNAKSNFFNIVKYNIETTPSSDFNLSLSALKNLNNIEKIEANLTAQFSNINNVRFELNRIINETVVPNKHYTQARVVIDSTIQPKSNDYFRLYKLAKDVDGNPIVDELNIDYRELIIDSIGTKPLAPSFGNQFVNVDMVFDYDPSLGDEYYLLKNETPNGITQRILIKNEFSEVSNVGTYFFIPNKLNITDLNNTISTNTLLDDNLTIKEVDIETVEDTTLSSPTVDLLMNIKIDTTKNSLDDYRLEVKAYLNNGSTFHNDCTFHYEKVNSIIDPSSIGYDEFNLDTSVIPSMGFSKNKEYLISISIYDSRDSDNVISNQTFIYKPYIVKLDEVDPINPIDDTNGNILINDNIDDILTLLEKDFNKKEIIASNVFEGTPNTINNTVTFEKSYLKLDSVATPVEVGSINILDNSSDKTTAFPSAFETGTFTYFDPTSTSHVKTLMYLPENVVPETMIFPKKHLIKIIGNPTDISGPITNFGFDGFIILNELPIVVDIQLEYKIDEMQPDGSIIERTGVFDISLPKGISSIKMPFDIVQRKFNSYELNIVDISSTEYDLNDPLIVPNISKLYYSYHDFIGMGNKKLNTDVFKDIDLLDAYDSGVSNQSDLINMSLGTNLKGTEAKYVTLHNYGLEELEINLDIAFDYNDDIGIEDFNLTISLSPTMDLNMTSNIFISSLSDRAVFDSCAIKINSIVGKLTNTNYYQELVDSGDLNQLLLNTRLTTMSTDLSSHYII